LFGQPEPSPEHLLDAGLEATAEAFLPRNGYRATVQFGYHCEECEEAVFPVTTRSELVWLKNRRHVVEEVSKHVSGGLDTWIVDGLDFLDKHNGHSVVVTQRR
jgi:methionyl-tRNA synthetase